MNKIIFVFLTISISFFYGCGNANKKSNTSVNSEVDSLSVLSELINNDSLNPQLFTNRARLYYVKGKIDPALRDLQSALKLNPNSAKSFLLLSDIYFTLGQTDNSIAALKKVIKLTPDNEVPFLKLSETYLLLNKPDVAIKYADEALRINRENAESYYVKAMAQLESKDTTSAIINFKISANLDSGNFMTFMQLGAIYTSKGDTLSKENFEKALLAKPDDERALYYLAMYYQEQGDYDNAINRFSRIAELYPDNKRVFYNMGYIYLVEKEDFDNAKIMFQKAIDLSPRYVEAVYNLGRTLEAMGDYKSARIQYKKALELLPNYPLAVQGMNRLDDIMIRNARN